MKHINPLNPLTGYCSRPHQKLRHSGKHALGTLSKSSRCVLSRKCFRQTWQQGPTLTLEFQDFNRDFSDSQRKEYPHLCMSMDISNFRIQQVDPVGFRSGRRIVCIKIHPQDSWLPFSVCVLRQTKCFSVVGRFDLHSSNISKSTANQILWFFICFSSCLMTLVQNNQKIVHKVWEKKVTIMSPATCCNQG